MTDRQTREIQMTTTRAGNNNRQTEEEKNLQEGEVKKWERRCDRRKRKRENSPEQPHLARGNGILPPPPPSLSLRVNICVCELTVCGRVAQVAKSKYVDE